jgi:hypothetical protein
MYVELSKSELLQKLEDVCVQISHLEKELSVVKKEYHEAFYLSYARVIDKYKSVTARDREAEYDARRQKQDQIDLEGSIASLEALRQLLVTLIQVSNGNG